MKELETDILKEKIEAAKRLNLKIQKKIRKEKLKKEEKNKKGDTEK